MTLEQKTQNTLLKQFKETRSRTLELIKTLEKNDNEKSITTGYWKNPKSGNRGVIKIKGHFGKPECRLIEHIFINKRKTPSNAFDTACRQESGQWAMIK